MREMGLDMPAVRVWRRRAIFCVHRWRRGARGMKAEWYEVLKVGMESGLPPGLGNVQAYLCVVAARCTDQTSA